MDALFTEVTLAEAVEKALFQISSCDFHNAMQRLQSLQDHEHVEGQLQREGLTRQHAVLLSSLPTTLIVLASGESLYISLKYLSGAVAKGKDSLPNLYGRVEADLVRIETALPKPPSVLFAPITHHGTLPTLRPLLRPLIAFVSARMSLIRIYGVLARQAECNDFRGVCSALAEIISSVDCLTQNRLLRPLHAHFCREVVTLQSIFQAQVALSELNLKDSCVHLVQARQRLGPPLIALPCTSHRSPPAHHLAIKETGAIFEWLAEFWHAMTSKSSVCFHYIFNSFEEKDGDAEQAMASTRASYVASRKQNPIIDIIDNFTRRNDTFQVALVMDARDLPPCTSAGYRCAGSVDSLDGMLAWPFFYSCPQLILTAQKANIVMLLQDEFDKLEHLNQVTYYDKKMQINYFVGKIDARMYIVISVKGPQRTKKDPAIDSLISSVVATMRHSPVFAMLAKA